MYGLYMRMTQYNVNFKEAIPFIETINNSSTKDGLFTPKPPYIASKISSIHKERSVAGRTK